MKQKYLVYSILVLLTSFSITGCIGNNDDEYQKYLEEQAAHQQKVYQQFLTDSLLIVDYLEANDSIAAFDSIYGIFYNILKPGSEAHPNLYSSITFQYKGTLLDGTVFDETADSTTAQFMLGNLISGWQVGIPKIGAGGKIILYLPSVYGYGETVMDPIPANSVLIFDIDLLSFY
ncbi:MAG: FKBP-type peptidyl-prolyl cis-trans isomerase [Prolixibacteraceae bacterium]